MEITVNLDISDPPRYQVTPCDEAWIDGIFAKCKAHGVQRMLWRVSLGRAYYHSRLMQPADRECGEQWAPVAEVLERLDPLECAVRAAKRHGVEILAWYPFSETYVSKRDVKLIDPFFSKRRDLFWISRDASRCFMGHPCVAESEARERLTAICKELSDYDVDGIFLSTRTHCPRPGLSNRNCEPYHADEFGFNDPVVSEVKSRCGVDISITALEDLDPEVIEQWHRVKGEFFTQWLRELSELLKPRDQKLFLNINPDRYTFIGNGGKAADCLRLYKDWECWLNDGILDGLSLVTPRGDNPVPQAVSVEPFKKIVPDGRFHVWVVDTYGKPQEKRINKQFELGNWYVYSPEQIDSLLAGVHKQGAAGIIMHGIYHILFIDSGGKDLGVGALPRDEYWPIFEKWAAR